jgi:hypothetical protein
MDGFSPFCSRSLPSGRRESPGGSCRGPNGRRELPGCKKSSPRPEKRHFDPVPQTPGIGEHSRAFSGYPQCGDAKNLIWTILTKTRHDNIKLNHCRFLHGRADSLRGKHNFPNTIRGTPFPSTALPTSTSSQESQNTMSMAAEPIPRRNQPSACAPDLRCERQCQPGHQRSGKRPPAGSLPSPQS